MNLQKVIKLRTKKQNGRNTSEKNHIYRDEGFQSPSSDPRKRGSGRNRARIKYVGQNNSRHYLWTRFFVADSFYRVDF
jgi:hypothetical protein